MGSTRGSTGPQFHRGGDRGRGRGSSTRPTTGVNVGFTGQGSQSVNAGSTSLMQPVGQVRPRIVTNNWSTQLLM